MLHELISTMPLIPLNIAHSSKYEEYLFVIIEIKLDDIH